MIDNRNTDEGSRLPPLYGMMKKRYGFAIYKDGLMVSVNNGAEFAIPNPRNEPKENYDDFCRSQKENT